MENEELNWRRQERERRRQQRLEEDRKLKMKLLIAAAVLIVSAVVIVLLANAFGKKDHKNTEKETETTSAAEKATEETTEKKIVGVKDESTVIHIKAVGDLNVTDSVILAGARSTGYDFTDCFMDVAPILSDADLTVVNLEGNLLLSSLKIKRSYTCVGFTVNCSLFYKKMCISISHKLTQMCYTKRIC